MIGVLSAFWLDQRSENLKSDTKEEQYLSLLQSDLREDSTNLTFLITYYERINSTRSLLINVLHEGKDLSFDSLTTLVNGTMGYRPFQASTETFRSLESSGELTRIKSDSIKIQYLKLLTMYQAGYRYAVESFLPVMYDFGLVRWPEFMDLVTDRVDNKEKLYNKEEIDYFELTRAITSIHIRRFNENLSQCNEVLELVNKEIRS